MMSLHTATAPACWRYAVLLGDGTADERGWTQKIE
jgi:hypothetical protein